MKEIRFWHGRRVLVTGCTGFLGSWVASRLVELGAEVVGLVRDQVPHSYLNRAGTSARINVVHGDLADPTVVRRALGEYEVDCVFHLAAQAIVGVANNDPLSTFESNVRGTWLLLEACRQQPRVTRIVIASSDKAYGSHEDLPYTESFPLQGDHPYDVSKSCADLIAHTYHHTYGLPVCITRCGNLFGGGDLNFNRIVPGTIKWGLEGERPIIRSDGTPMRDYIYVRDAVDAYLLLARSMDNPAIHGQAFNFGTAKPQSVLELTLKILSLMSREDLEPLILDEAKAEILHQYLSSEKAGRLLGWEPVADLDQGLRETIDWYTDFFSSRRKNEAV